MLAEEMRVITKDAKEGVIRLLETSIRDAATQGNNSVGEFIPNGLYKDISSYLILQDFKVEVLSESRTSRRVLISW